MTRSKSQYASFGFGNTAESRLRGTKFLSREQVLKLAKVSIATLSRALRVGMQNDRARWGQATVPGLRATYVNGALALDRFEVRRWMKARQKKDRRTSGSKKINRDPSKLRPNEQ